MTVRQKYSASSLISGISLLMLAVTFSACDPVEPTPAPKARLHFVTPSDDGAREILKFWDPATKKFTEVTSVATNGGIEMISGQPDGSTMLYATGALIGYVGVGGYYSIAENETGRYVRRLVSVEKVPVWSPDGDYVAWIQANTLYYSLANGVRTRIGSAADFKWSPDSRKIIYSKPVTEGIAAHIHDIATAQDNVVVDSSYGVSASGISALKWLSDSRHIIVSSFGGTSNHIIVDTTTPAPAAYREITTPYAGYSTLTASPTNDRFIAATSNNASFSVVFADGRAPVTLTSTIELGGPDWSATGDQIHYVADIGADGMLDAIITDDAGQIQQTFALNVPRENTRVVRPRSKDKFAFITLFEQPYLAWAQLTVVDLPSGNIHSFERVPVTPFDTVQLASWSPDSRYLAWGTNNSFLFLYDTHAPDTLSRSMNIDSMGNEMRVKGWSRDSKHIALCRENGLYNCYLAIMNVEPNSLTVDEFLVVTGEKFIWTGPGRD